MLPNVSWLFNSILLAVVTLEISQVWHTVRNLALLIESLKSWITLAVAGKRILLKSAIVCLVNAWALSVIHGICVSQRVGRNIQVLAFIVTCRIEVFSHRLVHAAKLIGVELPNTETTSGVLALFMTFFLCINLQKVERTLRVNYDFAIHVR